MEQYNNQVEAIVANTAKPIIQTLENDRLLILLPNGYKAVEQIDLSKFKPDPIRKSGTATLTDTDSFIYFVKAEGSLASCRIYVSVDYQAGAVKFTAVMNDHEQEKPHWRDYRATFEPAKSVEWGIWKGRDGKQMSQADFATFLEDNNKDIASVQGMPTGTQMLEMALNFEARQEAVIKSAIRLQSGTVAFDYTDKEDDATVKRMEVFQRFSLGIAPFFNGQPYQLDARLKYRINSGKLAFWYELIRPDLVLQDAAKAVIEKIKAESGFPVLFGNS